MLHSTPPAAHVHPTPAFSDELSPAANAPLARPARLPADPLAGLDGDGIDWSAYEPSADDLREWELHEGYMQMLADEAAERGPCECDHAGSFLGHDDSGEWPW